MSDDSQDGDFHEDDSCPKCCCSAYSSDPDCTCECHIDWDSTPESDGTGSTTQHGMDIQQIIED